MAVTKFQEKNFLLRCYPQCKQAGLPFQEHHYIEIFVYQTMLFGWKHLFQIGNSVPLQHSIAVAVFFEYRRTDHSGQT